MYKNILLPLDGSKLAEEIIPAAINLAKICHATITLMQIAEITALFKYDRKIESEVLKDRAEEYLNQMKRKIEEDGVSVNVVIRTGKPYSEILTYAEQRDVDLIIMSTYGMGGFGRWALGSVSEKVVRHSPKPVLLPRSRSRDLLRGKTILVVDDESDVLDVLEELLDMCEIHKAKSSDTALEYLNLYEYDIAILDIMGVDGFDLLKKTVAKGIPTVMLTAHALTADALRKSLKGGAVFYLPKDRMADMEEILAEVINSTGRPVWAKVFGRFAPYFSKRFRWSQKDEEDFMKEVEETSKEEKGE